MFYLAIDAGGTKTECAIAGESCILGRASGPSVKITRIPRSHAYANLEQVISKVFTQVGIGPQDIHRTCAGTAGASIPEVRDWMAESLARQVGGEAIVTTDAIIALEAAFHGGSGVLVSSGTGSTVLGRNQLGLTARAGGWGSLISDEGSGYWIGRAAVGLAMRESDRGNTSPLLTAVLKHWHLKSTSELVTLCNTLPPPRFGDLAPSVVKCAAAGDKQAAELLDRAGHELAELVGIVVHRLWGEDGLPRVTVACAGGVLEHSKAARHALELQLREKMPQVDVKPEVVDPITGALWIAREGSSMLRWRTEAMPVPDALRKS